MRGCRRERRENLFGSSTREIANRQNGDAVLRHDMQDQYSPASRCLGVWDGTTPPGSLCSVQMLDFHAIKFICYFSLEELVRLLWREAPGLNPAAACCLLPRVLSFPPILGLTLAPCNTAIGAVRRACIIPLHVCVCEYPLCNWNYHCKSRPVFKFVIKGAGGFFIASCNSHRPAESVSI